MLSEQVRDSMAPLAQRLRSQRALVTAAGQGIGRAIAERLIAEGAIVYASDRSVQGVQDIEGAIPLRLDVNEAQEIVEAVGAIGPLDILVNCAGMVCSGGLLDCSESDWGRTLDLNVTSIFRVCKAAVPGMIARGGGAIANIASVVGAVKGAPNRFAYATSKAAVVGLTRSIAADYIGDGIRCNAICPGTIETPSLHQRLQATGDFEKARTGFIARQPMGRLGTPEEVASLTAYLVSKEATFTTGQVHVIDGGWCG